MGEVQDCYGGFRHKDICPLLRRYRQGVKKGEATVASAGLHEAMVGFSTAAVSGGGGGQLVLAYMLRHMPKPYAQADTPIHRRRSRYSESLPYSSLSLLPSHPLPPLPP